MGSSGSPRPAATALAVVRPGVVRTGPGLLFRLVSYRYEKGLILITTNKAVKDWPEVLAGDEVMAAALLDRLLHRCHVIKFKGRSYRLRSLERIAK